MGESVQYPWTEQVADTWGHHAPELLSLSVLAAIVVGVRPPPGALALTVPVALMIFVVGTWLMMRRHDRRLCEHCMMSMPLNATEQAARYTRRFAVAHSMSNRRILLPYLVVLLGSNLAPGVLGRIFWVFMQLTMIYLIMSYSAHRRLQPWCPWCSGGGGGDDREDVTPDPPLPTHDRELV